MVCRSENFLDDRIGRSLKHRILVPEKMDDPSLDPIEHRRALAGLRRVNWFSGTGQRLAREIIRIAAERNKFSLTVLDLGCGGGDVACQVACSASSNSASSKLDVSVYGWDLSSTAIETAKGEQNRLLSKANQNDKAALTKVRFEVTNALQQQEERKFDVVYCCLFLHHFSEQQAVELLSQMRRLARCSVIVDDLRRTRCGWWLAKLGCHLLSRSPVVHFDGPQSVRAAFSNTEVIKLAERAGLKDATIRLHWPERFLLRWDADR